ncbi:MAG: protein phosphatase 2C domain-containing protein, partial [Anaerolineales bacterium]
LTCVAASEAGLAVGQLGDGVAVAGLEPGELFIAAPPQRGEYANETYFLTQAEALQQVDVRYYPRPVRMVAAMTDGLTRLAVQMALNEPHLPFFQPLLAFAAGADDEAEAQSQLAAFLASERVCARTDDDKTLVLALRRSRAS